MKKQSKTSIIGDILKSPISLYTGIATFMSIVFMRLGIEAWISRFHPEALPFYFYETLHTTLFFYLLFVICVSLTSKIARIPVKKTIIIYLFGFLIITLPPILDWIISSLYFDSISFRSYYLFDSVHELGKSFVTFFGDRPRDGITYGTRIMIVCALGLMMTLTFARTKSIIRTILIGTTAYTIFFILSAFPSLLTFIFSDAHLSAARGDVAGMIASPTKIFGNQITNPISAINIKMSLIYMLLSIATTLLLACRFYPQITKALLFNIRPVQTVYHIGLFCLGIGIALMFNNGVILFNVFSVVAFFLLIIAVVFAWYSTVILNDYVDQDIDVISNPKRPLIKKIIAPQPYKHIGIFLACASIIVAAMISIHASFCLIAYHAISFLYNTPPLRLKRFPVIATLLAAIASFFIIAMGFIIISPDHTLTNFPPHIALLLLVSYTISLPIKDLKDIVGDKKSHIYTIPVIFGERVGRLVIGASIFTSFILSVFALNSFSLFFPALLAGTLCFWVLVGTKKRSFIFSPVSAIFYVFGIVFLFGIILTTSLFL